MVRIVNSITKNSQMKGAFLSYPLFSFFIKLLIFSCFFSLLGKEKRGIFPEKNLFYPKLTKIYENNGKFLISF
jgi:hypothetical protein